MSNQESIKVIPRPDKPNLLDICVLQDKQNYVVYATYNLDTDRMTLKNLLLADSYGSTGVSKALMKNIEVFEDVLRYAKKKHDLSKEPKEEEVE